MDHNPPSREQQAYDRIMAENAVVPTAAEVEEYRKASDRRNLAAQIRRKLPKVF